MTGKSRRLKDSDIRRVFHLLGEITELGRDPSRWRLHLLQKLLPMIGARVGIIGEHFINPQNPLDTHIVGLVEWGWAPGEQERFHSHLNAGGMAQDPMHEVVPKLIFRSFTRRRRDFIPDQIWYASPVTDPLRRQCNVDDTIHTRCKLPQPGWAQFMSLMKSWGAEPFTERDRLLVSLLHRELGRLWKQIDVGALVTLPARLRQTLDLIFSGYSEKQMSQTLNVSTHTAHDFCRRLYRHFQVKGRGQLLTNPACRQLLFRPALSPAYYAERRGDTQGVFPQAQGSVE
jgi:hypothetical protein